MSDVKWMVHKFGGTSLADPDCYEHVTGMFEKQDDCRCAIVVSSMAGMTNDLLELVEQASQTALDVQPQLEAIYQRQHELLSRLPEGTLRSDLLAQLTQEREDIDQILRAVSLVGGASQGTFDWIAGYGEIWSARALAGYLSTKGASVTWLNAREVLFLRSGENGITVDWEKSQAALDAWLETCDETHVVITGFIASDIDGGATTLGRNGSDYSASILGALLRASQITIWSDVDGVLSADPRRVEEAELLDELSYHDAMELTYFGAKILHPHTMAPAIQHQIPIRIRNTFRPALDGTLIHKDIDTSSSRSPVKGFSTVDGMALLNVEGAGMIGVPGVAHRLFGALREVGVSVVMISQASSEHSICFAVPEAQAQKAKETVEEAFFHEMHHNKIQTIDVVAPCSILAAVGSGMVERPGVAAQFFRALSKAGVNVIAIAQGSSERNISAVIEQSDSTKALRAVHAGFYLSDQTLSVGLVGPGLIGKTLIKQLRQQAQLLREQFRIDLRIRGIANSKKMLLGMDLDLDSWEKAFDEEAVDAELSAFASHVQAEHLPHAVILDCTASQFVADQYADWLGRGIHVITPNKKANASRGAYYQTLRELSRTQTTHYLYEATVGAGLPVIQTLRDLIQTGDKILQIEGVFSGTLAYIFNSFGAGKTFSEIVSVAKEQGYTEPDPRDDLSGMDVARKVVILARQMGLQIELDELSIQNLVPTPLQGEMSVDDFLQQLPMYDDEMTSLYEEASANNEVLRYVGVIKPGEAPVVSLRRYPTTHPFARIQGSDNIIAFRTTRYDAQPLIVQGPGAGPEVTAGGVFADLLRLASYLGAPA